jgi:hypothetical protein
LTVAWKASSLSQDMMPPGLGDEPPLAAGEAQTGRAEEITAVPEWVATKYSPVTPSWRVRRPLGRGVRTPELAWIGVHLRAGLPRRTTRTPVPGLTQNDLPLSLALTVTVCRLAAPADPWQEPGSPDTTGGEPDGTEPDGTEPEPLEPTPACCCPQAEATVATAMISKAVRDDSLNMSTLLELGGWHLAGHRDGPVSQASG